MKIIKSIYISILIIIFFNLFIFDLDNSYSSKRRRACDKFLSLDEGDQEEFVLLEKDWESDPTNKDKLAEKLEKDEILLKMKKLWEPNPKIYSDENDYLIDLKKWETSNSLDEKMEKYKNFCHDYRYNFDNSKSLGNLIIFLIFCMFLVVF